MYCTPIICIDGQSLNFAVPSCSIALVIVGWPSPLVVLGFVDCWLLIVDCWLFIIHCSLTLVVVVWCCCRCLSSLRYLLVVVVLDSCCLGWRSVVCFWSSFRPQRRMKWWQVWFDWEAERGTLSQEKRPTETNISGKSQQLSQIYVGFTYDWWLRSWSIAIDWSLSFQKPWQFSRMNDWLLNF